MRGVGSGQERSFEQSVALFSDGFYLPRSRQFSLPLLDVERIEVIEDLVAACRIGLAACLPIEPILPASMQMTLDFDVIVGVFVHHAYTIAQLTR